MSARQGPTEVWIEDDAQFRARYQEVCNRPPQMRRYGKQEHVVVIEPRPAKQSSVDTDGGDEDTKGESSVCECC